MHSPSKKALYGGLGGATVSWLLWFSDLLSLGRLRFAGVLDEAAQQRVVNAAQAAIIGVELRLALTHLALGVAFGALVAVALRDRLGSRRSAYAASGGLAALAYVLALLGTVARYPQLYADRFWLEGGALARGMRLLTHGVGPHVFDGLLALMLASLGLGVGLRAWRAMPRLLSRGAWGAALVLVGYASLGPRAASTEAGAQLNVLILAADSLRTERLESREVMPFAAGLSARGSLFRFAYTPVARTVPSLISALTGLEPRRTDVRTMFPRREPLERLGPTFFSVLRDRGYHTFVTSDFAGDMFPRFDGGFETVDTPVLTTDTLGRSAVLSAHVWSLPLLRLGPFRSLFPEWRNLANLSDPQWLVDRALEALTAAQGRPFAGLVFFSNSHFPFAAPYPDYLRSAGSYGGRYTYHAAPFADAEPDAEDVVQIRARYDGALHSIDRAARRLYEALGSRIRLDRTLLVFMGDHGEELFEAPGVFGHGDVLGMPKSQATPILLVGPGVPAGQVSNEQVRLIDLGATVLGLLEHAPGPRTFGDGVSLFSKGIERPLCIETGTWFWPSLPRALRGERLEYAPISELLEVLPATREFGMRLDMIPVVENAKERGVVLGRRYWHERPTPGPRLARVDRVEGVEPISEDVDLEQLFGARCVASDPRLLRWYDTVVYRATEP